MTKLSTKIILGFLLLGGGFAAFHSYVGGGDSQVFLSSREVWRNLRNFRSPAVPVFTERERDLAQLGRLIFHDQRFSKNGQVSCATCHQGPRSFTDGLEVARGIGGTHRNTPTLVNSFMGRWFFWDGRADSLEAQVAGPLETPSEHGISRTRVVRLIAEHYRESYEKLFGKLPEDLLMRVPEEGQPVGSPVQLSGAVGAYVLTTLKNNQFYEALVTAAGPGGEPGSVERLNAHLNTPDPNLSAAEKNFAALDANTTGLVTTVFMNVSVAIAAFERGLVALDSPFDRFVASWKSESAAPETLFSAGFDEEAYHGLQIFLSKGRCVLCHFGPNFSDGEFHNIGLSEKGDLGLGRSLGVLRVRNDFLNCRNPGWPAELNQAQRESCQELAYLDADNLEITGAFKTPTLRNLATTGPYMHQGQFKTIEDVIEHYNQLRMQAAVGHREETLKVLNLTPAERKSLVRFLDSLNSDVRDLSQEH